jgi:hypothetical protein
MLPGEPRQHIEPVNGRTREALETTALEVPLALLSCADEVIE